jgi:PAS domain S-box-containing protein
MRLADAFEPSDSAIAVVRAGDGVLVGVNAAFERSTGHGRATMIGRRLADSGLWADPRFDAQLWGLLQVRDRVVRLPARIACADGREVPVEVSAEFAIDDGGERVLFCLLHLSPAGPDTPERARDDVLYRSLYLAASEGIYRSLPGGGFLDVNPAMARIFGFETPEQMIAECGGHASGLYVDAGEAARIRARLAAGERLDGHRTQVRRRDGRVIWISENGRAIRDRQGVVLFHEGSLVDITAQVEAEQALRQSRALYQVLVENSRDGVFLIQHGKVVFANEALAKILGCTVAELIGLDYMSRSSPPTSTRSAPAGPSGRPVRATRRSTRSTCAGATAGRSCARCAPTPSSTSATSRRPVRCATSPTSARGSVPSSRPSAGTASCSRTRRPGCSAPGSTAGSWR